MGPDQPLPFPPEFADAESYVKSLLEFGTTSQILNTLCGGVHILDFFTRSPPLYEIILPKAWRAWFEMANIGDVLDLLMREDLNQLTQLYAIEGTWRDIPLPPKDFLKYVKDVRSHLLNREYTTRPQGPKAEKSRCRIFTGMNPKKIHEVDNFAKYVGQLATDIESESGGQLTHLADFGAGQNYLGRVLASEPYNRHIVAIEDRSHVVAGARKLDVSAKVAKKPIVMRNKKLYKASLLAQANGLLQARNSVVVNDSYGQIANPEAIPQVSALPVLSISKSQHEPPMSGKGTVAYIEHRISNGDLTLVIEQINGRAGDTVSNEAIEISSNALETKTLAEHSDSENSPCLMVMSLHSCGNLVHHGLRTLTLNPAVKAVALVGCCYNLMTERLGPPTHKMHLRADHPRLDKLGGAYDPDGFPMSERLTQYNHIVPSRPDWSMDSNDTCEVQFSNAARGGKQNGHIDTTQTGVRLNITARMMAVQAPQNWTETESNSFFTRHFFRAVLQRIFLDKGVVDAPPSPDDDVGCSPAGSSWGLASGDGEGTAPVVIGNLSKKCYSSFLAYVRGAVLKLQMGGGEVGEIIETQVGSMNDAEIEAYECAFEKRKKELSIVWSLMAFSAGIVESMIVVDRWLWLQEQSCIKQAWVEPVFDYALSPRNLVVVGIK